MFPGYIFVRIDRDLRRWRPILSTLGVRTLVKCGDYPSLLEDGFIHSLKAREADGAIVRPANPYQVGHRVRVAAGPFDGLVATIIEMDAKDRLIVLMDLLNRPVRVKLAAQQVARA